MARRKKPKPSEHEAGRSRVTPQDEPVILLGRDRPPTVLGTVLDHLTGAQYLCVRALVMARPGSLSLAELVEKSGTKSPRNTLRELKKDSALWDAVIFMAGKPHGRYRIDWPEDPVLRGRALEEKEICDLLAALTRMAEDLAAAQAALDRANMHLKAACENSTGRVREEWGRRPKNSAE